MKKTMFQGLKFVIFFLAFFVYSSQISAQEIKKSSEQLLYVSVAGTYAGVQFSFSKVFKKDERDLAMSFIQIEIDAEIEKILYADPKAPLRGESVSLVFAGEYCGQMIILAYEPGDLDGVRSTFLTDLRNVFEKIERQVLHSSTKSII